MAVFSIRAAEPADLDFIYELENNSDNWKVTDTALPISKHILKSWLFNVNDVYESKSCRLMVCEQNTPVGCVDITDIDFYHLSGNVGVLIHQDYRKNGAASNAIQWACKHSLHHLGLKNLFAEVASNNIASISLFDNLGFRRIGERKNARKTSPTTWDNILLFQKELL